MRQRVYGTVRRPRGAWTLLGLLLLGLLTILPVMVVIPIIIKSSVLATLFAMTSTGVSHSTSPFSTGDNAKANGSPSNPLLDSNNVLATLTEEQVLRLVRRLLADREFRPVVLKLLYDVCQRHQCSVEHVLAQLDLSEKELAELQTTLQQMLRK